MLLIDAHAHMDHPLYKDDLKEVLDRAKDVGVKAVIAQGVCHEVNLKVLELAKQHPVLKVALGLYPLDALNICQLRKEKESTEELVEIESADAYKNRTKFSVEETLKFIEENKDEIVAIGEVGMDFAYSESDEEKELQKDNFRKIINLAKKIKKPLIIHSRKAEAQVIDLLEESKINPNLVVMHCFSGNKKKIKRAVDLGYYFSIPTNIDRSEHFQMMISLIKLDHILTETDSPYLAPNKAPRNEPANIKQTIEKIAELKEMVPEEVANAIFMNYQRLF